MTPPWQDYQRTVEYFATRMERVFDPYAVAEAGAAQTCLFLLDPARVNRLSWQQAVDAQQPGVADTLELVLGGGWKRTATGTLPGVAAVRHASNWVVLDSVLRLLDAGKLHPQVDAAVRQSVHDLASWLLKNPANGSLARNRTQAADLITRYLYDPGSVKLRPAPAIRPGAPI
jgi:hypothetical protein